MANRQIFKLIAIAVIIVIAAASLKFVAKSRVAASAASTNLITNSSFEGNIDANWGVWNADSNRTYTLFRSYEAPFGFGSYSGAIAAQGEPGDNFSAGLVTGSSNPFQVIAGKNYYFSFYAKATHDLNVFFYLERAVTYEPITQISTVSVTSEWQKYDVIFTPDYTGPALVNFILGGMPDNSVLYFDGVSLFENNIALGVQEIKGAIGDKNKQIKINGVSQFSPADINIELPYFDAETGTTTTKAFTPSLVNSYGINFDFEKGTFSGVGTVNLFGQPIGQFNYVVTPKITEYNPSLVRVDEDLVIYGTGFSPIDESTFAVFNAVDASGARYEAWVKPHSFDPYLSQMAVKLPFGITTGKLYIHTSNLNTSGTITEQSSNSLNYSIKPSIHALEWSKLGYEQVGDKLTIYGKGISNNAYVNFYDDSGKQISSSKAAIKEIGSEAEVIEVATPKNLNKLNVTVRVGQVESDKEEALSFTAKPKLNQIAAGKKRTFSATGNVIAAAKVGEIIKISGEGLKGATGTVFAEFQGYNERIRVEVSPENIDPRGSSISITVPNGALTGYVGIEASGEKSNYLPLEIIPTIESISPASPAPGSELTIVAQGVGGNVNLTKILFNLTDKQTITAAPNSVEVTANGTIIKTTAPLAISNKYSSINLQYDNWRDDESYTMHVQPQITSASFDKDSKILYIKGYGFSIHPKENEITYMYADHTVINPKAKILGVYPTEDGQEIRVKIEDGYYYGYVTVSVDGNLSNEANFGPVIIRQIARRTQFVASENAVRGVLYISGNNFGSNGGVRVGNVWARTHYRSNFFIIAVVDAEDIGGNPVIVTKE